MSTWKQKTIWQLVNEDGSLVTGWVKIGDYWYYMDSTGTMYQEKWLQMLLLEPLVFLYRHLTQLPF